MLSLTVDGRRIHDISSFYAELNRVFMQGVGWRLGSSLDALNDLLYGGYGALEGAEEAEIRWIAFDETQQALGVPATRAWLRAKLGRDGFDHAAVAADLDALDAGQGKTYVERVMEVFAEHPQWEIVPVDAGDDAFGDHVRRGCAAARELADRVAAGEVDAAMRRIRRLWVMTEAPSACPDAWAEIWAGVRDAADPAQVMSARDRRRLAALGSPVSVFRGALAGAKRGWSWTLERDVAVDFALRYEDEPDESGGGVVCSAEVPQEAILALFTEGGETEVVLDPARLDWEAVTVETVRQDRRC
ncbi:MAG: hypothetical protein Q4G34_02375 [Micrococcus sp.]|nr:hypothetical protein [Micrococcus sp.]